MGFVAALLAAEVKPAAQSPSPDGVKAWIAAHRPQIVKELIDLLSIPNVAADRPNIRRNAERLQAMLTARKFATEVLETDGNPVVYGERKSAGATRTLLLYAHYDGQPVEPRNWKQADPFVPVMRTGRMDAGGIDVGPGASRMDDDWRIYARSASDDKAPIVALCAALDALDAAGLRPTVNLRVILDGEEEAGSPSLTAAIDRYRSRLAADMMLIFDGPMHSSGRPTIAYGARGIVTFDLTVFGPRSGVHSGNYGNWVPNPAQRLASLLASMKDDNGSVLVTGFYDGIAEPSPAEQAMLDGVPEDTASMLRTFGVAAPETAFPKLQAALQKPTLNVRGLSSAFVGAGARTIVPDRAIAAMDIRLVKETRARDLIARVRAHVEAQGYHLVEQDPTDAERARYSKLARIAVAEATITNAFRTDPANPECERIVAALARASGAPPVQLRTLGGTVPIAPFIERLGFPALLVPTVNFDNNQHEENENVRLGHLFQAIEIMAALFRS